MGKLLSIYCDGAAHPRAGLPGGWAYALVVDDEAVFTQSGGHPSTTNNWMELQAALSGLREVIARGWHLDHNVELVSDSRFALDIVSGVYLPKKEVALCLELRATGEEAKARTRWVRGHAGVRWNEFADALAHDAMQALVPAKARRRAARRKGTR